MLDLEAIGVGRPYTRRLVSVGLVREPTSTPTRARLRSAAEVYRDFRALGDLDREVFLVLLLDNKNAVNGVHVVSVGSLAASIVHPREVFKAAILCNAASVIAIHNHPSGDPTPSSEDREITRRLAAAGTMLGIPLLDHIVIAADGYHSLAETGAM